MADNTRWVCASMYSPTVVSETCRLVRSNRGSPTSASSSLICIDTAGAVSFNSSAARIKLKCLATDAKLAQGDILH